MTLAMQVDAKVWCFPDSGGKRFCTYSDFLTKGRRGLDLMNNLSGRGHLLFKRASFVNLMFCCHFTKNNR